jgi:hypothetical protein
MIQALDLARENAALKDEVDRLRKELAELVQTDDSDGTEPSSSFIVPWSHRPGTEDTARPSNADVPTVARLVLIMPRRLALDPRLFASRFAALSQCSVIVDRRVMERRRGRLDYGGHERRQRDRRSDQRDTPGTLVLSLLSGGSAASVSEREPLAPVETTSHLVFHFEGGLCPRNPVRGEVRKGAPPPSEFPTEGAPRE